MKMGLSRGSPSSAEEGQRAPHGAKVWAELSAGVGGRESEEGRLREQPEQRPRGLEGRGLCRRGHQAVGQPARGESGQVGRTRPITGGLAAAACIQDPILEDVCCFLLLS